MSISISQPVADGSAAEAAIATFMESIVAQAPGEEEFPPGRARGRQIGDAG